jgi:hypothetical protein
VIFSRRELFEIKKLFEGVFEQLFPIKRMNDDEILVGFDSVCNSLFREGGGSGKS